MRFNPKLKFTILAKLLGDYLMGETETEPLKLAFFIMNECFFLVVRELIGRLTNPFSDFLSSIIA